MGQYLKNKRSSAVVNNAPKLPTSSQIEYGEIAINFAKGYETISIRNNNDEIATFSSDSVLDKKYISSGAVVSAMTELSGIIEDNEYTIAQALNEQNDRIIAIEEDLPTEENLLNSGFTKNALTAYTETDPTVPAWAKASTKPSYTAAEVGAISTATTYFDDVEYDSNTKRINFKKNNTVVDYVDATDFIKDGMVSSVTVSNGNLVLTFNTDAGREDITLALTQIFNPNNYYDKTTADGKFLSLSGGNMAQNATITMESSNYSSELNAGGLITELEGAEGDGSSISVANGAVPEISVGCVKYGNSFETTIFPDKIVVSGRGDMDFPGDSDTSAKYKSSEIIYTNLDGNDVYMYFPYEGEGTLAFTSQIPTEESIQSSGFTKNALTAYTETDPTVPSWAKQSTKPSYTASEVGALPTGTTLDGIADGTTRKLSNYSLTGHSHTAAEVGAMATSERNNYLPTGTTLDNISDGTTRKLSNYSLTGHTHDNYSLTSHTHSQYASTAHTHTAAEVGALPTGTTLDNIADGSTRKLSNYSLTSHTHTAAEVGALPDTTDIPTQASIASSGFTKNAGTLTGVTINGSAATVSNGNASFNIELGGGSGSGLPAVTAADNGKILQVVDGQWQLVTPTVVYTGADAPSNTLGNNGDIYLQTS